MLKYEDFSNEQFTSPLQKKEKDGGNEEEEEEKEEGGRVSREKS